MNTSLVCLVLALSNPWSVASDEDRDFDPSARVFQIAEPANLFDEITAQEPDGYGTITVYERKRGFRSLLRLHRDAQREYVARAQGLNGDGDSGALESNSAFPPTNSAPNSPISPLGQPIQPYDGDQPQSFAPLGSPVMPYMNALPQDIPPTGTTWGTAGPQPYRMGSTFWADMGWQASSRVKNTNGHFEVLEVNMGLTQTRQTPWTPWLFSLQHDFGYRSFDGPNGTGNLSHLPGSAYHFGWDARLETPLNSPYSPFAALLAFSPSINTDFDHSLTRNAINYDGRGILFFQANPQLLVALGAGFWDRVHDHVIPYVGVVWTPSSRWEWRLMFPQSRISWYAGNVMGQDYWLYASAEYHIESYEIGRPTGVPKRDQVELEDWRILLGARKSSQFGTGFIEGGWVLGRHANFRSGPDFDTNTGFIGRIGLSF